MNNFGFIKVEAHSPKVVMGNIEQNQVTILQTLAQSTAQILVFPELFLTGASLEDLFFQPQILETAQESLEKIIVATKSVHKLLVFGMPLASKNHIYNVACVIYNGQILGFVAKNEYTSIGSRAFSMLTETMPILVCNQHTFIYPHASFEFHNLSVSVDMNQLYPNTADIIIKPSAEPFTVGRNERRRHAFAFMSEQNACAIIFANIGQGESSSYFAYDGHCAIWENGSCLAENHNFSITSTSVSTEIDIKAIQFKKRQMHMQSSPYAVPLNQHFLLSSHVELTRKFPQNPYITSLNDLEDYLQLQVHALATRLMQIKCQHVVVGLSGGLDSTVCALVAYFALQSLGLPSTHLHTISMPGFGTGSTTKTNADALAKALGTNHQVISIQPSVSLHFKDINHNEQSHNVTFENAQARERTQILMDYANDIGAIVLGTGDMSELALGFCTYNGDHMAMYNVNAGLPKTVLQQLCPFIASKISKEVESIAQSVVHAPISPELLPNTRGEFSQQTEQILGKYDFHDFFLYYFIHYGYTQEKLLFVATHTFKGVEVKTLKEALHQFFSRFFTQQYKRNCSADGVLAHHFALSPHKAFKMPSDLPKMHWQ